MARVNITIPDELHARARAVGMNVSRIAAAAVTDELDRLDRLAELDHVLSQLMAERGMPSAEELHEAQEWARAISSSTPPAQSA